MSVILQTVACDWPGCTATVIVDPRNVTALDDRDWEFRGGFVGSVSRWHACPVHRFKTSGEFLAAIDGAESDG